MVDRPRPRFHIQEVAMPALATDFSNLGTINLPMFKQALAGTNGAEVRQRTLAALRQQQRMGTGVTIDRLPAPLRQSGLECQTMALLNGIQAWRGRESVAGLVPQIPQIRQRAEQIARQRGNPDGAYTMTAVEEVLQEAGLLRTYGETGNPVEVAQRLFAGDRFLGVANSDAFHAHTVLPLQATDDPTAFALRVDSLGGRVAVLSPEQFLDMVVRKDPFAENQVVYEVI